MIITTEAKPIKTWIDDIEEEALQQAKNLANLPFIHKHVALMPDTHMGYGMPIGGVIATENVIIPNAVGVDIGCGMLACQTSLQYYDISIDNLKNIMSTIRKLVPMGMGKQHKYAKDIKYMPKEYEEQLNQIVDREFNAALKQIGTLGSGNHFIEIQRETNCDDFVWIMVHSGSRNLGYKVAEYYNNIAIDLNEKYYSVVPKNWQLAFLPLDSNEGVRYKLEMDYCVEFALANRKLMLDSIKKAFVEELPDIKFGDTINIAHNYATIEHHFGKNVIVHRKGATLARNGTIGIIPGSQGSKSYIVKGLGNPDSFMSCSHGAGRLMSRTKARKDLDLEIEKAKLDKQGIIHSIRNVSDLDEAAGAYKDIDEVMANQRDLVEILVELQPLAVLKG